MSSEGSPEPSRLPDDLLVPDPPARASLEALLHDHLIGAEAFLPFVIERLAPDDSETEVSIMIELRGLTDLADGVRTLALHWESGQRLRRPLAVGDRTITEFAACGLACAVLACVTRLRVGQTAGDGERFDYWIEADDGDLGLEVSGTLTRDLEERHAEKVAQLKSNPFGIDGLAATVGFVARRVLLSFHRYLEETPWARKD